MRTRANINLDHDAYSFASAYACAKGIALGAAVSELLRQRAEQNDTAHSAASLRLKTNSRGLLVKARTGKAVTLAMVKEACEDEVA